MSQPTPSVHASGSQILAWIFARYRARIVANTQGTIEDRDPEHLHRMRTSTRRLRAAAKLCRGVVPKATRRALHGELGWLTRALGVVRDLDVMGEELPRLLAAGPAPQPGLLPWIEARRQQARGPMSLALHSERFDSLLGSLALMERPGHGGRKAGRPARLLLAPRLLEQLERLYAEARRIETTSPDEQLHALRIRGKRLRYGLELASPVLPVSGSIEAAKEVQDLLGAHQDVTVAETWVRAYPGEPRNTAKWLSLLAVERGRLRAAFLTALPGLRARLGEHSIGATSFADTPNPDQ
jgi:CHAD domain-containing protein